MNNQDKPMKRATTYNGRRWRALSMNCGICECGDLIGVDHLYLAEDGNIISHGHLTLENAITFRDHFDKLIESLKAKAAN